MVAEHLDAVVVACLAFGGNIVQWVVGRKKNTAAIALIDAQTISTLVDSVARAEGRTLAAWGRIDAIEAKLDACETRSDACEERADRLETQLGILKERLAEAGS